MKRGIFISYFLFLAVLISVSQFLGRNIGAGTMARLATVESIVERRTYVIDDASLPRTPDEVLVGGRFYGCQPPLLQTVIAPIYLVVRGAGGLSMSRNLRLVYAVMTICTVGVLSSLMVALFYGLMSRFGLDGPTSLLATATFGIGTLVLPYSTVLNAHIIGGSLIFFALYIAFRGMGAGGAFLAGLCLGGASTIDIPPGGIFSVTFLAYLAAGRGRRRFVLPALLGWFLPFALHCAINVPIMGSLRPGGVIPEYFDYPASEFGGASLSGVASHGSVAAFLTYAYHSLVGHRGFFSYNPVLLFPLAALLASVFSRRRGVFRDESILILTAVLLSVSYYLVKSVNYGGWAYGMRFFIPLIPPLAIYMGPFLARQRSLLIRCLFIASLVFSIGVSLVGAVNPWADLYIGPNPVVNNVIMAFGNLGVRPPSLLTGVALSIDEGDGRSLYYLGKKFYLYGWKDLARDALAGAVRADPSDPAPRLSLGNVRYDLGEFAAARDVYGSLRSSDPDYVSATHEYDRARRVSVIRVDPEDVAARKNMALLLAAEGRPGEAVELIRDYLENGDDRLRRRYRRESGNGRIEVVHPRSLAGLELLLERLEKGNIKLK